MRCKVGLERERLGIVRVKIYILLKTAVITVDGTASNTSISLPLLTTEPVQFTVLPKLSVNLALKVQSSFTEYVPE